jgi:hypothetical protein
VCRVVKGLELRQLAFQVPRIPEGDMVEKFSTDGPNQPLGKRV